MRFQFSWVKKVESMKTLFKLFADFGRIPTLLVSWVIFAQVATAQPPVKPDSVPLVPAAPKQASSKDAGDGDTEKVESKKTGTETSSQTKRGGRTSKIEQLEALVIEGKVQKPEVFYVLGRADARFVRQQIRKTFTEKIITSVADNPF